RAARRAPLVRVPAVHAFERNVVAEGGLPSSRHRVDGQGALVVCVVRTGLHGRNPEPARRAMRSVVRTRGCAIGTVVARRASRSARLAQRRQGTSRSRCCPRPLTCDYLVTYYLVVTDDDLVFKALADPTRRFLLDKLFVRDGRTLTELESELEMTRFGVMKHLRVLEDAGLVLTRRSGREKLHFLNPVPIRLIHDRWIDK